MTSIVRKTTEGSVDNFDFCCSSDRVDRFGDIVVPSGIDLKDFARNPIALFNHRSDAPIGVWENMRVEGNELRGRLKLAPENTSPRIDEIRALVKAKVLRATSIGFVPTESEPITTNGKRTGGTKFLRSELVETSLVSVPANSDAVALAKSLKISAATQRLVFKQAGELSLGERIRAARRAIEIARKRQESATTSSAHAALARTIANLEQEVRGLMGQTHTTRRTYTAAEILEVQARARTLVGNLTVAIHEIKQAAQESDARAATTSERLQAEYLADKLAEAEAQDREARKLMGKDAAAEQHHDWGDGVVRWRGVPVSPTTWRGKPVK
jgi:HK97 family phage prohead protease